ncbi:MAG: hypothetical protein KAH96_02775 [Alphaproteobacteria bacterium]|nr:hypothetical protein [Alphaproteobacteria bacterium]
MMKKIAQKITASFVSINKRGWKFIALVFLMMSLVGFSLTVSSQIWQPPFPAQPATPNIAGTYNCGCNSWTVCVPCGSNICCHCHKEAVDDNCIRINTSNKIAVWLANALQTCLDAAQAALIGFIDSMNTVMTDGVLTQLEFDFINWWETMWYYNLKPSLQNMTDQLNVSYAGQSLALHDAFDATATAENILSMQKHGLKDHINLRPSDNTCIAATEAGGLSRATMFAHSMRKAWQDESLNAGLNTQGMNVLSAGQTEGRRRAEFQATFCDPNSNGGNTGPCTAANPVYYSADVQLTKFIYNKLTINMDPIDDPFGEMARTIETINNNLVGVPSADVILPDALGSVGGQALFLNRRSYLARYGAIRSVPQLITGWRVPGGGREPLTGLWVKELRTAGGASATVLSDNPSYKEIMHAMTVDRFNSGRYAAGLITNESAIELEKLTLDVLYLMQLRDYYELLERTALTLAVQTSIMSDQRSVPDAVVAIPVQ